MIPKKMEAKLRETLIRHHIGAETAAFKAVMELIETDVTPERQWVYPRKGASCIVSTKEAAELLSGDDYSDHPDGFIIASDENNKVTRSWEKQKEVAVNEEIVYDPANGDTVFVRDQDGNAVGEPQYLKPLSMDDKKDEILARAVGVGIDPPDVNKTKMLALIEKKRVSDGEEPVISDPLVTVASSTEELVATADELGLIIPEDTPLEEAVKIINEASEKAKKSEG